MAPSELREVRLDRILPPPQRVEDPTTGDKKLVIPTPSVDHVERVIHGPCRITDPNGETLMIVARLGNTKALSEALRRVEYGNAGRSQGLRSRSKTFGYAGRLPVRGHEACRAASMANDHPEANSLLFKAAKAADGIYARELPEEYAIHRDQADTKVRPEYLINGTVFTSGIVNLDNALLYHRDAGNFEHRWSVMVVFRDRVTGGELVIPEWNVAHACDDNLLVIFNGQRWWHGVAPMAVHRAGYRITVVYYSLKALWKCLAPDEELARARKVRTERERKTERKPV